MPGAAALVAVRYSGIVWPVVIFNCFKPSYNPKFVAADRPGSYVIVEPAQGYSIVRKLKYDSLELFTVNWQLGCVRTPYPRRSAWELVLP